MKRLQEIAGGGRDDDRELSPAVATFVRGLSLGALVGAAIAGSALLQRRRNSGRAAPSGALDRDREAGAVPLA
jgi:hypothetical protein